MDIEQVRQFYLTLPYVSESFPFDESTLVFKVGSKMFGYISLDHPEPYICLKCDPERAIDLREHYTAVEEAYHMNKTHWNGVFLDRDLSSDQVLDLVRHSYELVYGKLTRKERLLLEGNAQKSNTK
ncbi:MAG: MmcQ/YjbR family DNA-binding protein [Porphyromonadaceae bacterium]|nr:MmcQ/YjbR family DNA-binding protein [Porphyromonadaceae bacterium]